MKLFFCVVLIAIGAQALTNEQKEKLDKISKECQTQSGASQELIDKARVGDLVDDPKLKAQLLCVSKKVNLATEAGDINADVLKAKLKKVASNDTEVDKLIQKCAVKKATPEETAFESFKCLYKEKPNFSVVD